MDSLVTIIIPVYNVELHIKKCIESLINQTYPKIEIILINDGSTDQSGEICNEYAKNDQRIKVIHQNNKGVSAARNIGLKKSTGNYIMFVDSDDWIEIDTVKKLLDIQNKNGYDIIMYGMYINNLISGKTIEFKKEKSKLETENQLNNFLSTSMIKDEYINSLCNKFYKSNLIREKKIKFNEKINIGEDLLFNFEVFLNVKSLYISEQFFYHYMIRDEESLTKKYNPEKYNMLVFVNDYMQLELSKDSIYRKSLQATKHIRVKNIYSSLLDLFSDFTPLSKKEKLRFINKVIKKEDKKNLYSDNLLFKILIIALRTNSKYFIYIVVYLMSRMQNLMKR